MKFPYYLFYISVLLLSIPLCGQQSHLLHFKLTKTGAEDWIEVYSNTSHQNTIFESDFSTTNTVEKVRLYKIAKYDKFEMEISVQENSANMLEFGISEQNTNSFEYKFVLNGTDFYTIAPGNTTIPQSYDGTSVFKFTKCRDELKMFHNNELIGSYSLANNGNITYETYFNPTSAPSIDISVVHTIGGQCLPHEPHARFALLNTEIPTTLTAVSNSVLRFYYFEKYNIVEGENDEITWELYDEQNSLILSGYLPNNFGSNYKTIDLISIPVINNHLLVVKGCNKNTTYYLKLKNVNQ
jgi:hypothetical protein